MDLRLHFDLCKNQTYNTFAAKVRFFTRKNLSKKPRIFYKLKMCNKMLLNIYKLKQK